MGRNKRSNNTSNNKHTLPLIDLSDDSREPMRVLIPEKQVIDDVIIEDHLEKFNDEPLELDDHYLSDYEDLDKEMDKTPEASFKRKNITGDNAQKKIRKLYIYCCYL